MSMLRSRVEALAAEILADEGPDAVTAILVRTRSGRVNGPAFPDAAIIALRCGDGATLRRPGETVEELTRRSLDAFIPTVRSAVPVLTAVYRTPDSTCGTGDGDA